MTNDLAQLPQQPLQQQPTPPDVYATFAGTIDQAALQRIFHNVALATQGRVGRVHLLFQSTGGTVSDGVCLYHYFRCLPVELCLYNVGMVASIGALAYLGANVRRTSARATFLLHRTQATSMGATAERLQATARGVGLDDERTEAILRERLTLPDDLWEIHRVSDLWLSAQDAIKYGLATEIAEFAPPPGAQLFNV